MEIRKLVHQALIEHAEGNTFEIHPSVRIEDTVRFHIEGKGHVVRIGENTVLRHMHVHIGGAGHSLIIGARCNLRGNIHLRQSSSVIEIGARTTSVGVNWFAMEGKRIVTGQDCMFSSGIFIRTSDEHPIFDLESEDRVNDPQDVILGDHIWIGEGATLNKGAVIADGCIIAARSFVSKKLLRKNSVYAGTPARLVREGIRWERHLPKNL